MTSSNGNIFRVTGPLCGEFTGEFPSQRPVTRSFDVFFDLRLNKRLSKQSWGWWFETPSHPLWRHCNVSLFFEYLKLGLSQHTDGILVYISCGSRRVVAQWTCILLQYSNNAAIYNALSYVDTKSILEPMVTYCQLDPKEHTGISVKMNIHSFTEMHIKMSFENQSAIFFQASVW